MTGVKIVYYDIAPNAKENFTYVANDVTEFSDLSQFQLYDLDYPNFTNPIDYYTTPLDGGAEFLPHELNANQGIGLWSGSKTNKNGIFAEPIVLTVESKNGGQYSSQGFSFAFDEYNDIFCNDLTIEWYRSGKLIDSANFYPDSSMYFCKNHVEYFDKAIIKFNKMNMPYNRLILRGVEFGYITQFLGEELRNVKLIQEIQTLSRNIPINVCDFRIDSKRDIEFSFQSKQPLKVFFNDILIESTFIKKSNRNSERLWNISSESYIGIMDGVKFFGGIYNNKNAYDLLVEIFETAKVPYEIDEALQNVTVSGHLPFTTCRQSLTQVLFAVQAVASTANSINVKVFILPDTVSQYIVRDRIKIGQAINDDEKNTGVQIDYHTYTANSSTATQELYNAANSGVGTNITVKFSSPQHSLSITNGSIVSSSANHAIINANNSNCKLTGKPYEHIIQTKSKKNPLILANQIEKIESIQNYTLVSSKNVDDILTKCYNYYMKNQYITAKIREGRTKEGKERLVYVGDIINTATEYLGTLTGRIEKETFSLIGGITWKDCVIR